MERLNVLLLPEPGSGHLMSLIEAGKRLLGHGAYPSREFTVTVLVVRPPTPESASEVDAHVRRVAASGAGVRFHHLPAEEPPAECAGNLQEFKSRYLELYKPHVRAAARELGASALVVDFFATTVLDVARELAVPAYVYFTCNAAALSFFLRLPELCEEVEGEFEDMDGAADIPGLPPVPPLALPTPVMERTKPECAWYAYHGRRFADADGIIVNTAAELEQGVLSAVADGQCTRGDRPPPTLYPIGPVISFPPPSAPPPHGSVRWLEAQPPASVVFLCFGSGGFFTAAQAHEVACGLERSGHRFLWVLRGPPVPGTWSPTDADLDELLPEGFVERTRGRGLVWPTTPAPQEILAHASVGGFVTHCGWNSVLESLWFGVPMAAWPLYAEQHLNAFALAVAMGAAVAMEVDRAKGNFVEAAEVERAVRELMGRGEVGRRVREKVAEMKAACRNAVGDGGSSTGTLRQISRDIVSKCARF